MATYSHVIWDWNGTLYDDVAWCVEVINTMLGRRGLPMLPDLAAYQGAFGFPIIDYYRRLGFDFGVEPFELLAEEYMALYHGGTAAHCGLQGGAAGVLQTLAERGLHQVVLSASRSDHLNDQLQACGIAGSFERVLGIDDIYAASKVQLGLDYMAEVTHSGRLRRAVLIGDSTHDHEVATALKADCLLVARGHQSRATLKGCGVPVLGDIREVLLEINLQ